MWNRTHVKHVIIVSDKINDLMLCHIVNFQNESYVCKYVAKLNRVFFFYSFENHIRVIEFALQMFFVITEKLKH